MKLIIGLGNPGQKYLMTRHNIGFRCIDALAYAFQSPPFKKEHKAEVTKIRVNTTQIIIAKPQTFMNLSGESVQSLMKYYDVATEDLLVIHDEVDLPFGQLKVQSSRGHGGNNGIRSIHQHLGTNEYGRIRFGVGRPPNPRMDVADYVLQNFNTQEEAELTDYLNTVNDAVEEFALNGLQSTANKFNQKG